MSRYKLTVQGLNRFNVFEHGHREQNPGYLWERVCDVISCVISRASFCNFCNFFLQLPTAS